MNTVLYLQYFLYSYTSISSQINIYWVPTVPVTVLRADDMAVSIKDGIFAIKLHAHMHTCISAYT